MKRRGLILRRWRPSKHFRTRGLAKAGLRAAPTDRLEQSHRAETRDIARVFGDVETDLHVTLRGQVIKLIGDQVVDQMQNPFCAREASMVQKEPGARAVGIFVDVVNTRSVECAGAADDAVDFIPFHTLSRAGVRRGTIRPGP